MLIAFGWGAKGKEDRRVRMSNILERDFAAYIPRVFPAL
jgi:hypothetical protein